MNTPKAWGKEVDIHKFMDSNLEGDKLYCRFRRGSLIHVDIALVQWFSKKQSTVETVLVLSLWP